PLLTRFVLSETSDRFRMAGILRLPPQIDEGAEIDRLVQALAQDFGPALAKHPALEDVAKLCEEVARHWATLNGLKQEDGKAVDVAEALAMRESLPQQVINRTTEFFGAERPTLDGEVFKALTEKRLALWRAQVKQKINWELFDRGMETYTWFALEEL